MRALRIDSITAGMSASLSEVPVPAVRPRWVLVKVGAFGLNNSERLLRHSEILQPYIIKPVIPGIECAGTVIDGSDTDLTPGTRIVACMGGMGRSFDGSYAEYAILPRKNVIVVPDDVDWSWAELGAFPETYLTAWGSLFECLQLQQGDTLLVRGATCGLGYVAIQLAKALGCHVAATTHRAEKLQLLIDAGADEAILDQGPLAGSITPADKILDLIGPRDLLDTLKLAEHGGIVCTTGILGHVYALNGFDPIKDIPNGVYLTGFFSNYPTQDLFDALFSFMERHVLRPIVNSVYAFDDLPAALAQQDAGSGGKIVVVHG
ncbi:MAG: zinc-binding dehydrogenase [Atopobiaceae bacterium]|nr:zinc-binding dehydrogenase [Atopobiaceae bacterium]